MVEYKVVIGKNFGDEGKGALVNLLCRNGKSLVVRCNGGAQAGHTVEEEDFRFVFHQLGSGSLQGCPVFWGKRFLPDLYKLDEEVEQFCVETARICEGERLRIQNNATRQAEDSGLEQRLPVIYADPECECVTVYDVILNSLAEQLRGEDRHGSCGMGIYETVLRSQLPEYRLLLGDFAVSNVAQIEARLRQIRDGYARPRMKELLSVHSAEAALGRCLSEDGEKRWDSKITEWLQIMEDDNVPRNAAQVMWENCQRYVKLTTWQQLWPKYERIVFENAQGLMLDWDNEEYGPHLTASHTGLKNVTELLGECVGGGSEAAIDAQADRGGQPSLEVCYVTRTYVTRHGAGRLDHEYPREKLIPGFYDQTNVYNPWQGELRCGKHPAGDEFFRYIRQDLKWLEGLAVMPQITIYLSHLDETGGEVLFANERISPKELEQRCALQGIKLQLLDHSRKI